MAKKKKQRLSSTQASTLKVSESETKKTGLPLYEPFTIIQTLHDIKPIKVWFEKNSEHMSHSSSKSLRICKSSKSKDWIVSERNNLSLDFSKEIARTFAKWLKSELPSYSAITNAMAQVIAFLAFLNEKYPISNITELTTKILLEFEKKINKRASYFKPIFSAHPQIEWKQLHYSFKKKRVDNTVKDFSNNLISEEDAFSISEFSEKEHLQIVGFAMHRLELIKKRRKELLEADSEPLKAVGCFLNDPYPNYGQCKTKYLKGRTAASRLRILYETNPRKAIDLLHQNMLIMVRDGTNGIATIQNRVNSLRQSNSKFGKGLFTDYLTYLERKYEPTRQTVGSEARTRFRDYKKLLLTQTPLNEFSIILMIIIQTGFNLEVVLSLRKRYGERHWTEMNDITLGVAEQKNSKRQVLRLSGVKKRSNLVGPKQIDMRVPKDSLLFNILQMYEEIFSDPNSDYFYSGIHVSNAGRDFCSVYRVRPDFSRHFLPV